MSVKADRYVIWSREHRGWWGPNRCGYTPHLEQAGRYSRQEAGDITVDVIPPGDEIAMDERVAPRFQQEEDERP